MKKSLTEAFTNKSITTPLNEKLPEKIEEKPLRYIIQNLESTFGTPTLQPKSDPLEMLIRVVLSQATTDVLSERTFNTLKENFATWEDVLRAETASIADSIKLGGLSNQKAKVIKELLTNVKAENGSFDLSFLRDLPVREGVAYLKKFRGVGPKTIACTLLFACHKNIFPLDTHIFRVLRRVGLIQTKCSDERAHEILDQIVPERKFYSFHVNLIRLGRKICRPQEPFCERCPIVEYCDFGSARV
ncbi:MAG: endonuclease III [Pyrinomonadaceae bacterium]